MKAINQRRFAPTAPAANSSSNSLVCIKSESTDLAANDDDDDDEYRRRVLVASVLPGPCAAVGVLVRAPPTVAVAVAVPVTAGAAAKEQ